MQKTLYNNQKQPSIAGIGARFHHQEPQVSKIGSGTSATGTVETKRELPKPFELPEGWKPSTREMTGWFMGTLKEFLGLAELIKADITVEIDHTKGWNGFIESAKSELRDGKSYGNLGMVEFSAMELAVRKVKAGEKGSIRDTFKWATSGSKDDDVIVIGMSGDQNATAVVFKPKIQPAQQGA